MHLSRAPPGISISACLQHNPNPVISTRLLLSYMHIPTISGRSRPPLSLFTPRLVEDLPPLRLEYRLPARELTLSEPKQQHHFLLYDNSTPPLRCILGRDPTDNADVRLLRDAEQLRVAHAVLQGSQLRGAAEKRHRHPIRIFRW